MIAISVIVPVYNTSKFLKKCLESIISQTLRNIEIIIVNDCSTDNSLEICNFYAQNDSRIKIINKIRNKGTLLARKSGAKFASGDYIVFLDSDDFFSSNKSLEKMYNLISINTKSNNEIDFVQYSIQLVDLSGNELNEIPQWFQNQNEDIIGSLNIAKAFFDINSKLCWILCGKIYKTSIVKKALRYIKKEQIVTAEDAYTLFVICCFSKVFISVKTEPLLSYRRGSGITSRMTDGYLSLYQFRNFCDELHIVQLLKEFILEEELPQEYNLLTLSFRKRIIDNIVNRFFELSDYDKKIGISFLLKFVTVGDFIEEMYVRLKNRSFISKDLLPLINSDCTVINGNKGSKNICFLIDNVSSKEFFEHNLSCFLLSNYNIIIISEFDFDHINTDSIIFVKLPEYDSHIRFKNLQNTLLKFNFNKILYIDPKLGGGVGNFGISYL